MKAQVSFGVRSGVAYSSLTQIVEDRVRYGGRIGYSAAGMMDIPFSRKFALRPELSLVYQGGSYYPGYVDVSPFNRTTDRYKCDYYSVQIPVNVMYKIAIADWMFGIYAGPSFSVSTEVKQKSELGERKFRPFDIGMGSGLHVECKGVFFTIYSHSGFLDRLRYKQSNESEIYQNNVTCSFGYWFH
jgi:hypothetical protein